MNLVFDGPAQPIGFALHSLLGAAPLGIWAVQRYVRKKRVTIMLPAIGIVWFVVTNGIQVWDQMRIAKMAQSGEGVHITRGMITQSWHIVSRKRDWTRSTLSYTTTVSEGFDVGNERFKWNIGDSFSPATFSNSGSQPVVFREGEQVEVTWFVDEAAQDSRRIVRLRMSGVPATKTAGTPAESALDEFHGAFAKAFASDDTATLTRLTRFPFRFGAHEMDADEAPTLWAGLLAPGVKTCIRSAALAAAGDGAMLLACDRATFVFRKGAKGDWGFTELHTSD